MNLFVLPSWYPSAAMPMAGLFVRDQVAAALAAEPALRVVVGGWGHHDGALSLRDAGVTLRALRWRAAARAGEHDVQGDGRWHEFVTPRLSWTLAWRGGGVRGLLEASRRNLARARERLGRVDLMHAHVGFPAGWIAAELSAESGVPYVLTEHTSPFPPPPLLAAGRPVPALVRAFERAATVIAVSPALAATVRSHGLPCHEVVPNVVDTARFAAAAAAVAVAVSGAASASSTPPAPGAPTDAVGAPVPSDRAAPFVLLALGALERRKGFDVLLEAFARWNPPAAAARLEIAGEGPERSALRAQAAALGLGERVRFVGALRPGDVPAAMARCDAFVLASRHETFGVVLAEALATGRPVIATRCGGPESIVGPEDGWLVPPDDAAALAAALARMHTAARRFDAAALRARAEARFGVVAVGRRLAALYHAVLGR